jgi:hypothetical protein
MKLHNAVALAVLVLATAVASPAREQHVKIDDLPAVVKQTVLEVSQGTKLRGLTREVEKGETFYEAELEMNGRTRDVIIDSTGTVVLIEEEVDWSALPAPVQAAIEKAAQGRKILLVETLTRNSQIEAYEAHMRKGWWGEMEIKVDPEGNPIIEK